MLRPRLTGSALAEATGSRPRWLTNGVVNLGVLCTLIVLMGMLSPRLGRTGAGVTFFGGLAIFLVVVAFFVGATRRLAERYERLSSAHAAADAVLLNLRLIGLPLLGLAFFLAWTLVYVGLWWSHPHAAFTGSAPRRASRTSSTTPSRPPSSHRPGTSSPTHAGRAARP